MMMRWWAVLPQWLGVVTMRQQRVVLPRGQEEEAGMWPQKVAPPLCGHFLTQPVSPAWIPCACSFHELKPMQGVPVLECMTHHAIFEGLGPRTMVCICHVLIEPSYKFLPKLSVGQVALLQLLCYSGVELIKFGGGVEQAHCSWPYGTSDWGCNATADVSEDVLPVGSSNWYRQSLNCMCKYLVLSSSMFTQLGISP